MSWEKDWFEICFLYVVLFLMLGWGIAELWRCWKDR